MNTGKALLGVVVGIAAGAALGVLFAPDKGTNTRKNIVDKGQDLANALNERIDAKIDELSRTIFSRTGKVRPQNDAVTTGKGEMVS